ncbi:hypothetical protein HMPREF2136_09170 [Prevotella bivia DNF00650]|nr:RagB/SusD family nutrient uptake outer membrane protein [Prevotella bivia]KGF35419.1 hypothetical protein HMPREF2136_09170 [Prevotella bivia DNF00650]MDU3909862.1 RagB/SusD family nutrient uptake outer membrane protein [Prevotella bivia]
MKYYLYKYVLVFATLALCGCNDFLDKIPDSDIDVNIDNEEGIAQLLAGAYPEASYIPFLEPRTDNVDIRANGTHTQLNEEMFYWEDDTQEDIDTPLNYWNSCYKGIAQANKALELLKKYPKNERVKALYGEAFLLRAYLHFMLVNIWAEPYGNAEQSPGIPYVNKPEKHALTNYNRGTVSEVYDSIESDLKRGVTLVSDRYYKQPKYHFNKKAAYTFASRFYLMKGEWEKVVEYANYVLGADPKTMLRHWVGYSRQFEFKRQRLSTRYTSPDEPGNLLICTTESRWARQMPTDRYGSTKQTVDEIFNKRGIEGGGDFSKMTFDGTYPFVYSPSPIVNGKYIAKFDELSTTESIGLRPRGIYVSNVLFTADEALLNRMEAYAMLKQYDRAINDYLQYMQGKFGFMPTVERDIYMRTSENNYDVYTPFYGMTLKQLALVKLFADFRQKEFFAEGLRWLDIRRFHLSVKRNTKSKYYFPLEKDDPRKVLQIPIEAQNRGLAPNPRERKELIR